MHTFFVTSGDNLVLCTCCKTRLVSNGVFRGKSEQQSVSGTQDVDNAIVCWNPGTCARTPSVYIPIVSGRGYGGFQEGVHRVVIALTVNG